MNTSYYKYCIVPHCKSTVIKTPKKLFIYVPNDKKIRKQWLKLAKKDNADSLSTDSRMYFCEDHFDLPNDMVNYMMYHVMGSVSQIRMKPGCVPTRFDCQMQSGRQGVQKQLITKDSPVFGHKMKRKRLVSDAVENNEEIEGDLQDNVSTCSKKLHDSATDCIKLEVLDGAIDNKLEKDDNIENDRLCRICLHISTELYNIMENSYKNIYEQFTGSKLIEDNLPQNVCRECMKTLISANHFRERALKSREFLITRRRVNEFITLAELEEMKRKYASEDCAMTEKLNSDNFIHKIKVNHFNDEIVDCNNESRVNDESNVNDEGNSDSQGNVECTKEYEVDYYEDWSIEKLENVIACTTLVKEEQIDNSSDKEVTNNNVVNVKTENCCDDSIVVEEDPLRINNDESRFNDESICNDKLRFNNKSSFNDESRLNDESKDIDSDSSTESADSDAMCVDSNVPRRRRRQGIVKENMDIVRTEFKVTSGAPSRRLQIKDPRPRMLHRNQIILRKYC